MNVIGPNQLNPLQFKTATTSFKVASMPAADAPVEAAQPMELFSITGETLTKKATFPSSAAATQSLKAAQQAAIQATLGLPAVVLAHFSAEEWAQLNPGRYHDQSHPVHVANTVAEVATNLGRSPETAKFLQQVALLHDVDERIDLKTGKQNPVSPARVPVTLEWMDRNQDALSQRMGWDAEKFTEAKTLIARTDFPFNNAPKNLGTRYDGQTPVEVYKNLLEQVPPERRESLMQDGLLLRFADQTGNYTNGAETSRHYIQGLTEELQGVGVPTSFAEMAKGSPAFLATAGTDLQEDFRIAGDLHVDQSHFAKREELVQALPPTRRNNLAYVEHNVLD